MDIVIFINLIKHLKTTAKRSQGIKTFYNFIKMLKLTKNFKYKEYTNQKKGLRYFCIDSKKWLIFEEGQGIQEYILEKACDKYHLRNVLSFDNPKMKNKNIELILDWIVNANWEKPTHEFRWDYEENDDYEPHFVESFVEYKNDPMDFASYDENVFSFLVLVVFNKYDDIIGKNVEFYNQDDD